MTPINQLVQGMQQPMTQFVERVRDLAGQNCLAITAFGAIATSGFDRATQTASSVVVLQSIELPMLRSLAKEGLNFGKAHIAAPLMMTPEYITESLDSFPLEFLEIQQCHLCLVGDDYFAPLSFAVSPMRLQCERELKTILIAMRQGLLAAAGREKLVGVLEGDIAQRLMRTLRGLLWLHGQQEQQPDPAVLDQIEQETQRSLPSIRNVLYDRRKHTWEDFTNLYHEIDGLKTVADKW